MSIVDNFQRQLLVTLALAAGCTQGGAFDPFDNFGGNGSTPPNCSTPDLAVVSPACPAARGLSGKNLLCADFSQTTDLATLSGWQFTANCPAGWEVVGGKLQVKNFGSFQGQCQFGLPTVDLNSSDNQKYSGLTLSILQRVAVNNPQHIVQGGLGSVSAANRTFWTATGKSERQQLTIPLPKGDPVPMAAGAVYQYLFQINSTVAAGGTSQGWQIESIAVNASE